MKIQLIAIGNELLNGKTVDKNAFWLAQECFKRQYNLQKVQIVGDNPALFINALKSALLEADVILTTGGLGPTKDDLTKAMICDYLGFKSVKNNQIEQIVLSHFKRGGREYDYERFDYHNCPLEIQGFYNPTGYAPGLGHITSENKIICALPGVPNEYKAMMSDSVFKFMEDNFKGAVKVQNNVIIKTWKLPEADIFGKLCPTLWEDLEKFGEVSSLPHMIGVDIGVFIEGENQKDIEKRTEKILSLVKASPINEYIWHIGSKSLEEVIIEKASSLGLTFGFAESATGGLCSDRISNISGSSKALKGGVVCYGIDVKINLLKVDSKLIQEHSVYSDEVSKAMAQGCIQAIGCDIAVAITGVAGPNADGIHPAGKVSIAVSYNGETKGRTYKFQGDREGLKFRFSQMALFTLLEELESIKPL